MIEVRTKGVPLKREVRKDAEGYDCFSLDESKFDPFEVLLTTMRKCGYVDPPNDLRLDRVLDARRKADLLAAQVNGRNRDR